MTMQKQLNKLRPWTKHKWLLAVWCMLCVNLAVYATTMPTYQPNAWGNTAPEYQFRSTSAYQPALGSSTYSSSVSTPYASAPYRPGNIRRDGFGDPEDETDLGVGEIANPAPVGSPLALLLFALIYGLYAHFGTQCKQRPEKLKNQEE